MISGDHPFNSQLADLTSEELDKRHSDLLRRWQIARRMGMDQHVLHQLDLFLNSIEVEKYRRSSIDERPNGVLLDTDPIPPIESKLKGKK